jgi:hypothetical protein
MAYQITLPDGSIGLIDDSVPRNRAMEAAQAAYPDAFPGIGEQLLGAPGELLKGLGRGIVDPVTGLASTAYTGLRAAGVEMAPFAETGVGKGLAGVQEYLAPDYGTVSEFAGAVGGLGSFLIPGTLMAKGLGRAATLGGMATGLGAEEARSRVEQARAEGTDVSTGQEFAAQLGGTAIGLTELAPIERLTGPLQAILRGVKKSDADMIAPGLFNSAKRMVETGGIEGLQEGMANVAQDLLAKGIYNPELDIGESALGDAAMGASVGAFAQGVIELVTKGKRKTLYDNLKAEEDAKTRTAEAEKARLAEEAERKKTLENFGIEGQPLLLAAPQAQVTPSREEKSALDKYGVEEKELFEPFGTFSRDELDPTVVKELDKRRKEAGRPKTESFTIQDIADTGVYRAELDRLLAQRSGFTGQVTFKPAEIVGLAQQKNIDTSTQGFSDFVSRVTGIKPMPNLTGANALRGLNDVELFAVREALNKLPVYEKLKILPTGKSAKIFDEKQANKTLTSITKTLSDKLGAEGLGETTILQEIGDFSGLGDVNDQRSLLEKYITEGKLERTATPAYGVFDAKGNQVTVIKGKDGQLTQAERVQAQRKAQEIGGTVKGVTINNIKLASPVNRLIGGADIREGVYEDNKIQGYDITTETGEVIGKAANNRQAEIAAQRVRAVREQRQQQLVDAKQKIEQSIAAREQELADLEALGQKNSEQYSKLQGSVASQKRNLGKVEQSIQEFGKGVTVNPRHAKQKRTGYTLFQGNKPVGTYNSRQEAMDASVVGLPTDKLEAILDAFPTLKADALPGKDRADIQRIQQVASQELAARTGQVPSGVGVTVEGDITAAEERLALQGIFSPRIKERVNELDKKLRAALDSLGLKDVRLNIVGAIKGELGVADGAYAARLIKIALDAENPMRVLRHESIHALKELGAFTPDQWRVLENKAKSEWIQKYNIMGRYQGLDPASMIEEAIADAFSDFSQTKPPAGLIRNIFDKIKAFFTRLDNAFKGFGFQTSDDVFTQAELGQLIPGMGERAAQVQGLQAQRVTAEEPERYSLRPRKLKSGEIVGSPPNARTEPQRTALVRQMTDLLRSPFTMLDESKNWYEDSGAAIRSITRGDPELTERVVRLMALYSQANGVGGNTTATIKSIYQLATGQPTAFAGRFPNTTAERIPAILAAPTMDDSLPGVDDKLMNFYRNLHDATYQTDTFDDASTIDRWMMRLFGYPHTEDQDVGGASGLSNTQYTYAKDLVRRISDAHFRRSGERLLPRQIQAALWTYVKNKTDYDSLPDDKKASFEPSIIDFSDYITRATANITWETRPSTSINLLPGIHKAPRNEQEAFNRAVREIFVDEDGNDLIFQLLGGEQLYSSQFSMGAYENQIAPNIITKLVLRKDDNKYLGDAANKYASIVGYVTRQDAVPWYRADPTAGGKFASTGFRVTPSVENVDPAFEQSLFDHLNTAMPGVGFTRIDNAFDFVNFRGEDGKPFFMADKKYKEKLQEALESFPGDVEFNVEPFRAESAYISNNWKENANGEGYLSAFSPGELADIQNTLDGWRSSYDTIADQFGRDFGWNKFSLRSPEPAGGSSTGSGLVLGESQPGAKSFTGTHYGKQRVDVLSGSFYGTGIKGAEAARLAQSRDFRIKKRVYFYVPFETGTMPRPEAGLGNFVYKQTLNNILPPGEIMSRFYNEAGQDANEFESAIVDAGYDGYAVPSMGMMVVLNHDVPVEFLGTRDTIRNLTPTEKFSLRTTDTPEFKQWFGRSTIVDAQGRPKVMYHGTARDITEFKPKRSSSIFVTPDPEFADDFGIQSEDWMVDHATEILSEQEIKKALAEGITKMTPGLSKEKRIAMLAEMLKFPLKSIVKDQDATEIRDALKRRMPARRNIMPVYVRAENPFDFENPEHIRTLKQYVGMTPDTVVAIKNGSWDIIEEDSIQDAIKEAGFDSFYMKEGGRKNLAVYKPDQIKSVTGNIGTYGQREPTLEEAKQFGLTIEEAKAAQKRGDIRYSLRATNTPEFKQWFKKSPVVDAVGKPQMMFHGTALDIEEFIPGQANAIYVSPDPEFAGTFAKYSSDREVIKLGENLDKDLDAKRLILEPVIDNAMAVGDLTNANLPEHRRMAKAGFIRNLDQYTKEYWMNEFLDMPMADAARTMGVGPALKQALANQLTTGRNVMPLYVNPQKPFDFENKSHVKQVSDLVFKYDPDTYDQNPSNQKALIDDLRNGDWRLIEEPVIQEAIKELGFDAFYVKEQGLYKNLGLYRPNQIKSAIGNEGTFSSKTGDIRYSLRSNTPPPENIQRFFGQAERLETTPEITELRDAWIGGVSDAGLNEAAYYLDQVPGGKEYTKNVQKLARQILGDRIKGFRLMSKEELENIQAGDLDYYAAFSLNPNTALSFANFVNNSKIAPQDLVVVEADINPGDIHMIGKEGESEIVADMSRLAGDQRKITEFAQPVRFSLRQQAAQTLGQGYLNTVERTTTPRVEQGLKDRIAEAISPTKVSKFRQMFINKYEAIEVYSREFAKKFGNAALLADTSAISAALMSDRAAGVAAESFKSGIPVYNKGYTYVDNMNGKVKGLMDILMPLAQRQDPFVYRMFQDYAGRRRGVRLDAQGKVTPFTSQELAEIPKIEKAFPEFKQVFEDYQRYNEGLVRYMRDTGVIDAKAAQEWMKYGDYIPFYRQLDGERTVGPSIFSAISGVKAPKKLKGGDAPLGEFLETVIRNSRAAIEAGMRNVAANRVVNNFQRLNSPSGVGNLVEKVTEKERNLPDVVTVRENGKDAFYQVADPLLVQSLQALNIPQIPGLDILAAPASFLREMVTRDPAFIGASVLRESLSAWITTGQRMTPIVDGVKQFGKILANASPEVIALRRAGIGSGYEFKGDVQATSGEFAKQLKQKAGDMSAAQRAVKPISWMWDSLDKASTAADLSTRAEVFKRVMEETGNEAEAVYQAMEVINFSRKGSSPIIQIFAAIIPFLNARIQGLDLLYRAGFGRLASANKVTQHKAFMLRSLALLGTTAMYYALVQDDDEWQRADQETRDNYWIIGGFKFPIPFELGVMFKVIPERIMAYTMGDDTGKEVRESIARQVMGTLSFNPIPQAVLPLIEASANYSFFLQRDIVGMGKRDLAPEFQTSEGTSKIAIELGQTLGISPMKIDYVLRGYTGSMGTYAITAMDSIIRSEDDATKATWRLDQIPVLKRFMISDLGAGTVNDYYDLKDRVDEVVRTSNQLERTGNVKALSEYLKENGQVLGIKDYVRDLDKDMKSIRESKMAINMSRMDPDQKRDALDALRRAEISLTERIGTLRKSLGV